MPKTKDQLHKKVETARRMSIVSGFATALLASAQMLMLKAGTAGGLMELAIILAALLWTVSIVLFATHKALLTHLPAGVERYARARLQVSAPDDLRRMEADHKQLLWADLLHLLTLRAPWG